jgi:formiminoglutamase
LEKDQAALGRAVAWVLEQGSIAVVLGGGHETSFGHFLGYLEGKRAVSILNIDAHPDVRPLVDGKCNSGTQFRQALEHPSKLCKKYDVIGLQPHAAAVEHLEFIRKRGGQTLFRDGVSGQRADQIVSSLQSPAFVSFDLDAVDEAWAPGVSSPTLGGLHPDLWLHLAALAGASPAVSSIDVVEFNPTYDQDGRSARLAALTIWHFLTGVVRRLESQKKPRLGFGR